MLAAIRRDGERDAGMPRDFPSGIVGGAFERTCRLGKPQDVERFAEPAPCQPPFAQSLALTGGKARGKIVTASFVGKPLRRPRGRQQSFEMRGIVRQDRILASRFLDPELGAIGLRNSLCQKARGGPAGGPRAAAMRAAVIAASATALAMSR